MLLSWTSNTFDPFAIISLSLNSQTETESKNIEVYFLYENLKFRMLAFEMDIKKDLSIKRFRQKINYLLQVGVYGFEMFLLKDDTPILIDESEYNTLQKLMKERNNERKEKHTELYLHTCITGHKEIDPLRPNKVQY